MSRTLLRRFVPAALVTVLVAATLGPGSPAQQSATGPAKVDPKTVKTVAKVAGLPDACETQPDGRIICTYTGGNTSSTLAVPAGATDLRYTVAGAQGSNGDPNTNAGSSAGGGGAGGARLQGSPGLVAGKTLTIAVGSKGDGWDGGGKNPNRVGGNFGGGNGGNGTSYGGRGGHGGAGSALVLGNDVLVVAGGGGGGAGGHRSANNANAGGAGGTGAGRTGNTIGGDGGNGERTSGSGGGGGGGGYVQGGNGGSGGVDERGNGGQGGGNYAGNGASVDPTDDKTQGVANGVNAGDGVVQVAWYRSNPGLSVSSPSATVYAYQSGRVLVGWTLPNNASGTVSVTDTTTNTSVCSNANLSSGSCAVPVADLTGGSHTFRVDYSGDGGYQSASATTTFSVSKNTASISLSSSTTDDGQTQLSATIAPTPTDANVVDGTFGFSSTETSVAQAIARQCNTTTLAAASAAQRGVSTTASCTLRLPPGSHSITGALSGTADTNSISATTSVDIAKYTPTVSLAISSRDDPTYGSSVTATVTVVAPDNAPAFSGQVYVLPRDAGTNETCTSSTPTTTSGQTTTYSCQFVPRAGTTNYRARTVEDDDFDEGNTTTDVEVTTTLASPTLTITATPNPVDAGKPLTIAVSAKGGDQDLDYGSLLVYDGEPSANKTNLIGTVDLAKASTAGHGSFEYSGAKPGAHLFYVEYSGANYTSGLKASDRVTVSPLESSFDVAATSDASGADESGVPTTITATLSMSDVDTLDAAVKITKGDDVVSGCTRQERVGDQRTVDEKKTDGEKPRRHIVVTCTERLAAASTPVYVATYEDDLVGALTKSSPSAFAVAPSPTTVTASADATTYGSAATLSAVVRPTVKRTPVTGSVTFREGDTKLCDGAVATDDKGVARFSCTVDRPEAGTHAVVATFTPDAPGKAYVSGSVGDPVSYTVSKASAGITLTPSVSGNTLVASASVATSGGLAGEGQVSFGGALESCPTTDLTSGAASCSIPLPSPGTRIDISATYLPSKNFQVSGNATVTQKYQRPASGVCKGAFDKLWSATKAANGTYKLGSDAVGTVTLTAPQNLGDCDSAAVLSTTADVSLFGGTLTASKIAVSATAPTTDAPAQICIGSGKLALPTVWKSGALNVTAPICFTLETGTGDKPRLGAPLAGRLSLSNSDGSGAPLLAVPGVTGSATLSATFGVSCKSAPVEPADTATCDAPKPGVTITGTVSPTSTAPGVTVTATVTGDGDIAGRVTSTAITVLGTSVTLSGSISRSGSSGSLTADVSATTTNAATPATGLTLAAGAVLTLTGGTGTTPGFGIAGTVSVGTGSAALPLHISGSFSSPAAYSLNITTTTTTSWTPVDGLTFTPDVSGTLVKDDTGTHFSVTASGSPLASWQAGAGATVRIDKIEISDSGSSDPKCPATGTALTIAGSVSVSDLTVDAVGCISLTGATSADRGWHIGAATKSGKTVSLGRLSLGTVVLDVSRKAGGAVELTGSATASLTIGKYQGSTAVTMSASKGGFVVGGSLDTTSLGLPTSYAYLAYASAAVTGWQTGLGPRGLGDDGRIDLPAGISLFGAVTLPSGVASVLRNGKFSLPSDSTVTFSATVPTSGSSLSFRAALANPSGFPILTLPGGATITSAAVGYENGSFSLAATGTVKGQDGNAAPVSVAITIAGDGSFTGTASVTGLGLFGRTVDLSGSVSRTASGSFSANVAGSISGSVRIGSATLHDIRVAVGTSGLGASGKLDVAGTTVDFTAAFASTAAYSLRVSTTVRNWTPARGVTVDAAINGSLTRNSTGYDFDLAATPLGDATSLITITPSPRVTMKLTSFALGNGAAPAGCTLAQSGDTWLAVSGSVALAAGSAAGAGSGTGCFDLTNPSFSITVALPGNDFGDDDGKVSVSSLSVKITRAATGDFSVVARARLSVQMPSGGQFSILAPLAFGPDGIAVGGVADLTSYLGRGANNAYIFFSYTKMTVDTGDETVGKLKLSRGITIGLAFTVSENVAKALHAVDINVGEGSSLLATVQLDLQTKTVKLKVDVGFKSTRLFSQANGSYLQLDDMSLQMTLSSSLSPSFGFVTNATLHVPAPAPGATDTDVSLTGGIRIGTELSAYLSISGYKNAFGLRGFDLDNFTLQGGITLTGLPLPSLAISASVSGLPSSLAGAIGYRQGAPISLTLAIGETNLLVDVKIGSKGSSSPALAPFDAFGRADLLSVNYAELYLSPTGATVGTEVYPAGFSLAFQGRIVGVNVDVLAKVDPIKQTMYFRGTVGTISIGSLVMGPTTLTIDVSKTKFDLGFTGAIKLGPSTTQVGPALRFSGSLAADVSLKVGTSGIGAALNFSASVSSEDYLPQDWCEDDGIWTLCNYRWVATRPLSFSATNIGFDVNSSGLTVKIPNTLNSITFPWPKSALSAGARSLTGRGQSIQTITSRQTNVPASVDAAVARPAVAAWQRTGSLGSARLAAASLALKDGRVLAIGGSSGNGRALDTVESYDATTGGWREVAAMHIARINPSAVQLADGRVLVVGGDTGQGETAAAEIYDPASNRWTDAGAMSKARQSPSLAVLRDGSVLVAGGHVQGSPQTTADRFDPKSGSWREAASLPEARAASASTLLADDSVLVAGGMGKRGPLASTVRYDADTNSWRAAASMAQARFYASATTLDDGSVLVVGGASGAEKYQPATDRWTSAGMLTGPTQLASTVKLADGDVLVAGGLAASHELVQTDRYDAATGRWAPQAALPGARAVAAAALLPSGGVLVAGGLGNDSAARADAVVFRPDAGGVVPVAGFQRASASSSGLGTWSWLGIGAGIALLLAAAMIFLLRRPRRGRHLPA